MNQYVRIALAVLAGIAVALQATYPDATWAVAITTAITATLGALHLVPAPAPATSVPPDPGTTRST